MINFLQLIKSWRVLTQLYTAFLKPIFKLVLTKCIIALLIININTPKFSYADTNTGVEIKDQIVDILTGLTCETQGIGDLLASEFSHTCIPAPFLTFVVANIVAPITYANTMLRLKLNDKSLFPGACRRENRIDPARQRLDFALCSNMKLAGIRILAIGKSLVAIGNAMITGTDPWENIKNAWDFPKSDYHNIYTDNKEGAVITMVDLPVPVVVQVIKENDRMCVAAPGFTGWIPVGCKYIREPYPRSIYSNFFDSPAKNSEDYVDSITGNVINPDTVDTMRLTQCSGTNGCFQRAFNNSRTGIVITAPILECIKEMVARLLISQDVCTFDDVDTIINMPGIRNTSMFYQFQQSMHRFVTGFLTIYVVLFGIKLALSGESPPRAEIMNFIVKIVLVTYFSIGINVGGGSDRLDGMIQWVIPTLLAALEQLAGWVMAAAPSDLCVFEPREYAAGFGNTALWDALDCRVSHYLGLDLLRTMIVENAAREHDFANFDFFNFAVPPYYYLLIPAVMSGNMTLVSLALMYPLLVLSVAAYLVNSTVVCIIAIVILSVLAPLFVPMVLFNYTKGYFEAWFKLMLSFVLQPMVVVVFMMTMFSVYDKGFYGECKYAFTEMRTGSGTDARTAKIFYLNNHWADYTPEEERSCKNSLGFILNNPLAALYDFTKTTVEDTIKENSETREKALTNDTQENIDNYDFLSAITSSPGLFFTAPKLIWEKIKDLILALIIACFTLYLMYHFSAQLAEFAADMTEGVSLNNVSIKPQAIFKAGMAAINAAGQMKAGLSKDTMTKGRGGLSQDTQTMGGGGSSDTSSVGGGSSSDTSSVGTASSSRGTGSTSSDTMTIGGHRFGSQGNTPASENYASNRGYQWQDRTSNNKEQSSSSNNTSNTQSTTASRSPLGLLSPNHPDYKPMNPVTPEEAGNTTNSFFRANNINPANLRGYSAAKFNENIAFASRSNIKQNQLEANSKHYEDMLKSTLSNAEMKGKEASFTQNIESLFTGSPRTNIEQINKKVLDDLNIKQDSNQAASSSQPANQTSNTDNKPADSAQSNVGKTNLDQGEAAGTTAPKTRKNQTKIRDDLNNNKFENSNPSSKEDNKNDK